MKVLIVGSGGREHALAWKIGRSPMVNLLVCAPGNPGMAAIAQTRVVAADDAQGQADLAREIGADLVVVGPETAIAAGLADRLQAAGIPCFGGTGAQCVRHRPTLAGARALAYGAVDQIMLPGGFCRRDIGWRALEG